jgi:lysine 6-dehydrogenase
MAWDFLNARDVDEVVLGDINAKRLKEVKKRLSNERLRVIRIDAADRKSLRRNMKSADIVANALIWHLNVRVTKAAIEAGVSIVDVGSPSSISELDNAAKHAGVTVVPNCGLDPGIDRILISYGASKLDKIEEVTVRCGGFPQKSVLPCPLSYKITWSVEGVIASYVDWDEIFGKPQKPGWVTIVKDGKKVLVKKLSGLEKVQFPDPVGECECVYTHAPLDVVENLGLKDVRECYAKTVRWPGHLEKFKTLVEAGLTDTEAHIIDGVKISPRQFLISHLSRILQYRPGEGDVVVMRVNVNGQKSGKRVNLTFSLVDMYDNRNGLTAMERTTGLPCAIVAQMIVRGDIAEAGVKAPENVVPHEKFFQALDNRGINITRT